MLALRQVASGPTSSPCWCRLSSALVANNALLVQLHDGGASVTRDDVPVGGVPPLRGVRCAAVGLGGSTLLLLVDEDAWHLLDCAAPGGGGAWRSKTPVVHRQPLTFWAQDCALSTQDDGAVVVVAGPLGLHVWTRRGRTIDSAHLFRRSSMACCTLSAAHVAAVCMDGHVAVVPLSTALPSSKKHVAVADFCAFLASEQRPTHAVFAPSGHSLTCVAWDGTALVVVHDEAADLWRGVRLIPSLPLQTSRIAPPAFVLRAADGDEQPWLARGSFVHKYSLESCGPGGTVVGVAQRGPHIVVLDSTYSLWMVENVADWASRFVCEGLTGAQALESIGPHVLPLDCVVRGHWARAHGVIAVAYECVLVLRPPCGELVVEVTTTPAVAIALLPALVVCDTAGAVRTYNDALEVVGQPVVVQPWRAGAPARFMGAPQRVLSSPSAIHCSSFDTVAPDGALGIQQRGSAVVRVRPA